MAKKGRPKMDKIKEEEIIETTEVITEVEEIKDNSIATMHNKLIEARYRLTIEEQRIILALISLIQPDDEDFKDYKIPVKVLSELIGTKHKNMYKVLDEATNRLMQRIIKIETIDNGKDVFKKFAFISYAEYKRGEGYFIISIDKHLKPYLLKLKERFTSIPLKYVFPLRSVYAIRLYELLKQYENTGYRVDKLEDLKEMLGIEPEEYKDWRNFERIVLKRATKEINEKTDIEISYNKKKTGRKITHIEFFVRPKENIKEEKEENLLPNSDKKGKKFDKDAFWEEVKKYRKKYWDILQEYLEWVKKTKASNHKIEPSRYLTENQVLFLLINTEDTDYPSDMVLNMIRKSITNKQVKNPMGFLIDFYDIDMFTAKFTELTTTDEMLDKEEIEKELKEEKERKERDEKEEELRRNEEIFKEHKKVSQSFVNAFLKTIIDLESLGQLKEELTEMLSKSVVDKENQKFYIPAKDTMLLDWFEINFKEELESFIRKKVGKEFEVNVLLYK